VSDRGNTVTDYRERDDHVVSKMQKLLHGKALIHSFNTVSERGSSINLSLVLAQNSKLNLVLLYLIEGIPDHIERLTTTAESLWKFPLQGSVRDNAAKERAIDMLSISELRDALGECPAKETLSNMRYQKGEAFKDWKLLRTGSCSHAAWLRILR